MSEVSLSDRSGAQGIEHVGQRFFVSRLYRSEKNLRSVVQGIIMFQLLGVLYRFPGELYLIFGKVFVLFGSLYQFVSELRMSYIDERQDIRQRLF